MPEYSIDSFVAFLAKVPHALHVEQALAMEKAARLVEDEAKQEIGTYQEAAGPFVAWEPLAESTLEQKERAGYAPPDSPLLRTGEMRDSIQHHSTAEEAEVGSDDDRAVWQELGTSRIPPRSFLGGAAVRKADDVAKFIEEAIHRAFSGRITGL
jgi:phage gpG-like protein